MISKINCLLVILCFFFVEQKFVSLTIVHSQLIQHFELYHSSFNILLEVVLTSLAYFDSSLILLAVILSSSCSSTSKESIEKVWDKPEKLETG